MQCAGRTTASIIAAGALFLTGCSGSGNSAAPAPPTVVAGQYSGTVTDSVAGAQPATTTFSQHGSAVGGTITTGTGASASSEAVALTISGAALSGSGSMDVNGSACTFAFTASYASGQITGTYNAVSGCSGRTGTLALTQQCTIPAASVERQTRGVVPIC